MRAHLDYLYVLTCADVRGTNPKLWNSWKASLFHEFYERVKRALRRGLESPIDQEQLVRETSGQRRARLLHEPGVSAASDRAGLGALPDGLFPAAHARGDRVAHPGCWPKRESGSDEPLVALRSARRSRHDRGHDLRAAPAPRVCAHDGGPRSAGPEIRGCAHHADRQMDSASTLYHVLEDDGAPISDNDRQSRDRARALALAAAARGRAVCRLAARAAAGAHVQHTDTDRLSVDERNRRSVLELTAGDRPGLLSDIGKVLMEERVRAARCEDHDAWASGPRTCSTSPTSSTSSR